MHVGVVSTAFGDRPIDEVLAVCRSLGIAAIELGAGGYSCKRHCDPGALNSSSALLDELRGRLADAEIAVSALNVSGEPLHPDPEISGAWLAEFREACALAPELGTDRIVLMAGLPAAPGDRHPNWVTYAWPPRNVEILEWQWRERAIPFWREQAETAAAYGLRLCFEMHPNDLVYRPDGLLRLRDTVGQMVGANLDPSHLVWQGMDLSHVVAELHDCIYHVHAKDVHVNDPVARVHGVLDPHPQGVTAARSWSFRTVGYGGDMRWWRSFVSSLRMAGYDDVLSIEHEDPLVDSIEGLSKAASFLRDAVLVQPAAPLWFETPSRSRCDAVDGTVPDG